MFKCPLCLEISQPGDPQFSLVTETREKTYTLYLVKKNSKQRGYTVMYTAPVVPITSDDEDDDFKKRISRVRVITKHGREIVKELKVCRKCLESRRGASNESTSTPIQ